MTSRPHRDARVRCMPLIAGVLDLATLMASLAAQRPVFHSEADLQFAFAQAITAADPTVQVRLEIRQTADRAEYVDLGCWTRQQRTLVEFKYATAGWTGTDRHGERYMVRNHAAYDLARRYFIHDIRRLERFTAEQSDTDGIAIMLTNEPSLWINSGRAGARDTNFRIHQDRDLTGHLAWGTGATPKYDQHLTGTYPLDWHDYSTVEGRKGQFRWLAVPVTSRT
jgi:hypothetical protein